MPEQLPKQAIEDAQMAVAHAQLVRKTHAKRTDRDSPQRQEDIAVALIRLRESMNPLRREIGRFPYGPQTTRAETNRNIIREASQAVQRERRKLWKMQQKGE